MCSCIYSYLCVYRTSSCPLLKPFMCPSLWTFEPICRFLLKLMWKLWVATSHPTRFVLQYRMDRRRAEPKSLSGYCDEYKNVHPCRESNPGLEDCGITYRYPICQRLCPYPAFCQLGTGSRVTGPELNTLARRWVRRSLPALPCLYDVFDLLQSTSKHFSVQCHAIPKWRFFLSFPGLAYLSFRQEWLVGEDECGALAEWNWQGKTEVLWEIPVPVPLRPQQFSQGWPGVEHESTALRTPVTI